MSQKTILILYLLCVKLWYPPIFYGPFFIENNLYNYFCTSSRQQSDRNFTTNCLNNFFIFITYNWYMLRLYNVAIFRELQVWSTFTEYLEIVQLVGGEICNLYSVWRSSSALHFRIMIHLYQRAWIHSLQFVWLPKLKEFRALVHASQFLSLPFYATYGLWYMFWTRVALFLLFSEFFSASHIFSVMLFSKENSSQNDMLQNCSLPL
jgi:hypothetical protein